MRTRLATTINGEAWVGEVRTDSTVLEFVREELGLTATKRGCEWLACGVCTVLLDGRPVSACGVFAVDLDGAELWTLEGLSAKGDPRFEQLQAAFVDRVALQCGYCTPGQLTLAHALVSREKRPDSEEVRAWMSNNLCRCGSYVGIYEAVCSVSAP